MNVEFEGRDNLFKNLKFSSFQKLKIFEFYDFNINFKFLCIF